MPLINCEINLIPTWPEKVALSYDTKATTFAKTDAKIYIPSVPLSAQANAKLIWQLKPGFKRTINWKNYQSKVIPHWPKE